MAEIIIAPFSNSGIRDWPIDRYAALIGRLLTSQSKEIGVRIIGTANQRIGANEIVRAYPPSRVVNACGRHGWPEIVERLTMAKCVIANNSGIAHLGGYLGVPTVSVFGGSHQRHEWHARGRNVVIVSRSIGCSPCQLDHGCISPYDKACLREIDPDDVVAAIETAIMRAARPGPEQGGEGC